MSLSRGQGQILLLFALLMPVIATGATLAMDTGYWMIQKRQLQYAVDQAAIVGAQSINETTDAKSTTVVNKAEAWLQKNIAFPSGVTECVEDQANPSTAEFCAINHSPQSAPYNDTASSVYPRRFQYVEVIINTSAQSLFYTMFNGLGFGTFFSQPIIRVRAVAGGVQPVTYAVLTTGTASASACGTNPVCFGGGGGGGTIGGNLCSNGGVGVSGTNTTLSGTVVAGGTIQTGLQGTTGTISPATGNLDTSPACPTPPCSFDTSHWASLESEGDVTVSTTPATLAPGRYNSITIDTDHASNTVILEPGVYYLDGSFDMTKGTIEGVTGVTFIVKGDFRVRTNSTIGSSSQPLSAKGSTPGAAEVLCNMLIWIHEDGTNNDLEITSNDPVWLSGTIYAPGDDSEVNIGGSGGGSTNLLGQVFGVKIQIQGTGTSITYDYSNTAYIPAPYLAE